jgi:ribonuclease HI
MDDTKPPRFYGVAVGRKPGVYTEWPAAQEAIIGWKGPKYKKFETRAEAEAFVRSFSGIAKAIAPTVTGSDQDEADGIEEPVAKKRKTAKNVTKAPHGLVIVYTDGSSLGNGRAGATAGVGVYFGDNDPRFVCQQSHAS